MIHNVYSVYDKTAQAFMQPFMSVNHGTAQRALSGVLRDPQHQFAAHPADYLLCHLATFDDGSAIYTQPQGGFTALCSLLQLMPKDDGQQDLLSKLIDKE